MGKEISFLLEGNKRWQGSVAESRELKELYKGQHPNFLVFHCSDSRVSPALLFDVLPGEIFSCAVIGNIVGKGITAIDAVVEYAVGHLGIENIIVLGHSNCGGMSALASGEQMESGIREWLSKAGEVKKMIGSLLKAKNIELERQGLAELLTEANVLFQVKNLLSMEAVGNMEKVKIFGWVYDLKSSGIEFGFNALKSAGLYEQLLETLGLREFEQGRFG